MTKVVEKYKETPGRVLFMCDYSPPRGAAPALLDQAQQLDMDFICVAYNPSKSVRVDSAITAAVIRQRTGRDVVFNLACRDMNKLAVQSHLLGAAMLGLENVIIVKGDDFSEGELAIVKEVNDFRPTELLRSVQAMNEGVDYRGLKLRSPTSFCVGATADPARGLEREARLAHRKAEAGASFFITQSLYRAKDAVAFHRLYRTLAGEGRTTPIFYGLPILEREGVFFGDVPQRMKEEVEGGRSGVAIALELLEELVSYGIRAFYLVPPIMKGGVRDYTAAQTLVDRFRKRGG